MNLRALQKYMVVIIAGAVFLVALGGILWLWQRAAAEKTDIVSQLEDQQSQLNSLLATKPAPSPENIKALKDEREQVKGLFDKLQEGTLRPPIAVTNLEKGDQFRQLLNETVTRLESQARRNAVKIPENFRFGFSRYEGESPCKPGVSPEECKKHLEPLGKQLFAIEKLSNLLMESRVDEIIHIRRAEVDPGTQNTDALDVPISPDPKGLYQSYPFEFEFTCGTKALRAFLNNLANAESIFIVRSVKIDSATTVATTGGPTPGTGRTPEAAPSATEPTRSVEHRRLTVTLRVDLVEFIPATSPAKGPS